MENQRGKGLSFARRIYRPRIIGLGIGGISVFATLYPLALPGWIWALLLFHGLLWPHLAYQLSTRSAFPYQAERRNLLYDSMLGGFWAATMQFNPLPAVTILSMMAMNNVAAGGVRLFIRGALAQGIGVLLSWSLFGASFNTRISPLQIYACLPMLTLYPLAVGMVCYRLAIKLSEHKRALSALSRTDSLTGLLNHGSWKDLLHIKFHKCQQQQINASIALIDIDHFKAINDTYGHVAGDVVLRQLSKLLRQNLRVSDQAGRYGGDEFCVILPDVPLAHAAELMEALRGRFGALGYEQSPALQVSLSIGLAAFNPLHDDAMGWLNDADQALYAAKTCGRNNVTCHPPEQPSRRLLNSL